MILGAIWLPSAVQATSDRELVVLRALGQLGPMRMSDLASLVLVGQAERTSQALMRRLVERGTVWETRSPGEPTTRADGRPGPPRSQRVVWLND